MTISVATVQNIPAGGSSIIAINPPPEGQQGAQVAYSFAPPGSSPITQTFQMSSAAGLPMSQVVSLCIDNTESPFPLTLTHGAFQEQVTVAAFGYLIVPTFSNKSPYQITLALQVSGTLPTTPVNVTVVFLNYARQSSAFSGSSLAATTPPVTMGSSAGQASGLVVFNSVGETIVFNIPYENWYLWDIDIFIGSAVGTLTPPSQCLMGVALTWGTSANWEMFATGVTQNLSGTFICVMNERAKWSYNSAPFQGSLASPLLLTCFQLTQTVQFNCTIVLTLTGAGTPNT